MHPLHVVGLTEGCTPGNPAALVDGVDGVPIYGKCYAGIVRMLANIDHGSVKFWRHQIKSVSCATLLLRATPLRGESPCRIECHSHNPRPVQSRLFNGARWTHKAG